MATEKFNATAESIFMGLFRDALQNDSYDQVTVLWKAYSAWLLNDPEIAQRKFIEVVRMDPICRSYIKGKRTDDLAEYLRELLKENREVCAAIHYVADAVKTGGGLFHVDAEAKTWKRVQKLVYACNLQRIVSDTTTTTKAEKRTEEVSHVVRARISRFNTAYRSFLETLSSAFPEENGQASTACVAKFDELVAQSESSVISTFKEKVLPMVPQIAKTVQNHEGADAHAKVFYEYFGHDSRWFRALPLIDLLPVDIHWNTQMYVGEAREPLFKLFRTIPKQERDAWWSQQQQQKDREIFERVDTNQMIIMKAIADLACCMSGLDTLIYSPIVAVLKERAKKYTTQNNITPEQLLPNNAQFDRGVAMGLVMSLLDAIPEATGGKVSKADMETLIQNTLIGNPEYPASFNEVFSPDMLDMDCLASVTELPGIGDALAPIMASMQGQLTGVTGAKSAFGSVAAPAWLERDASGASR